VTSTGMPRRFLARLCDDGSVGVWDCAINAWRSAGQNQAQAEQHAADLELQFDAWGPRPAQAVRRVQPPVAVDNASWQPAGLLDHWIRVCADDSFVPRFAWYGRVRTESGAHLWLPAEDLRRAEGSA
jgi:hypothetical protein